MYLSVHHLNRIRLIIHVITINTILGVHCNEQKQCCNLDHCLCLFFFWSFHVVFGVWSNIVPSSILLKDLEKRRTKGLTFKYGGDEEEEEEEIEKKNRATKIRLE